MSTLPLSQRFCKTCRRSLPANCFPTAPLGRAPYSLCKECQKRKRMRYRERPAFVQHTAPDLPQRQPVVNPNEVEARPSQFPFIPSTNTPQENRGMFWLRTYWKYIINAVCSCSTIQSIQPITRSTAHHQHGTATTCITYITCRGTPPNAADPPTCPPSCLQARVRRLHCGEAGPRCDGGHLRAMRCFSVARRAGYLLHERGSQ